MCWIIPIFSLNSAVSQIPVHGSPLQLTSVLNKPFSTIIYTDCSIVSWFRKITSKNPSNTPKEKSKEYCLKSSFFKILKVVITYYNRKSTTLASSIAFSAVKSWLTDINFFQIVLHVNVKQLPQMRVTVIIIL